MPHLHQITPCLWFNDQAEEAAVFYTGIFKNSKVESMVRDGEAGKDVHRRPPGSVMTWNSTSTGSGLPR